MTNAADRYDRLTRACQADNRVPALSVALHRADRPLWTLQVGDVRHRRAAGRRHPVPDRLGHEDLHRRCWSCSAATTGCSTSTIRSAATSTVPAHGDLTDPAAAVAHVRASSASRTATSGTRCSRRASTSCSPTSTAPNRCCRPAAGSTTPTSAWRCSGTWSARCAAAPGPRLLADRVLTPLGLASITVAPTDRAAAGLHGRRVLRPRPPGARYRLRRRSRRPRSCGAPPPTSPGGPAFLADPAAVDPAGAVLAPKPRSTRCAGRSRSPTKRCGRSASGSG